MSARKVGILAVTLLAMAALVPAALLLVTGHADPAAAFGPSLRAMLPMEVAPMMRAAPIENRLPASSVNTPITADAQQSYFGDLTVERDQVLAGNVIVYDGDVTIERDGRINGDLVVYSGDVKIRAGGGVGGNVTAFSGDMDVAGEVNGNLAAMNGDVTLEDSARVNGNVSILNGDLERADGAVVGGNVVKGAAGIARRSGCPAAISEYARHGAKRHRQAAALVVSGGWGFRRVISAGMFALLIGLIAAIIVMAKPELVDRSRQTIVAEPALSFVAGIVANLMTVFVAAFLAITICLMPVSLVLLLVAARSIWSDGRPSPLRRRRGNLYLKSPVRSEIAIGAAIILTRRAGLALGDGRMLPLHGDGDVVHRIVGRDGGGPAAAAAPERDEAAGGYPGRANRAGLVPVTALQLTNRI